jgi:hypothetical protein
LDTRRLTDVRSVAQEAFDEDNLSIDSSIGAGIRCGDLLTLLRRPLTRGVLSLDGDDEEDRTARKQSLTAARELRSAPRGSPQERTASEATLKVMMRTLEDSEDSSPSRRAYPQAEFRTHGDQDCDQVMAPVKHFSHQRSLTYTKHSDMSDTGYRRTLLRTTSDHGMSTRESSAPDFTQDSTELDEEETAAAAFDIQQSMEDSQAEQYEEEFEEAAKHVHSHRPAGKVLSFSDLAVASGYTLQPQPHLQLDTTSGEQAHTANHPTERTLEADCTPALPRQQADRSTRTSELHAAALGSECGPESDKEKCPERMLSEGSTMSASMISRQATPPSACVGIAEAHQTLSQHSSSHSHSHSHSHIQSPPMRAQTPSFELPLKPSTDDEAQRPISSIGMQYCTSSATAHEAAKHQAPSARQGLNEVGGYSVPLQQHSIAYPPGLPASPAPHITPQPAPHPTPHPALCSLPAPATSASVPPMFHPMYQGAYPVPYLPHHPYAYPLVPSQAFSEHPMNLASSADALSVTAELVRMLREAQEDAARSKIQLADMILKDRERENREQLRTTSKTAECKATHEHSYSFVFEDEGASHGDRDQAQDMADQPAQHTQAPRTTQPPRGQSYIQVSERCLCTIASGM